MEVFVKHEELLMKQRQAYEQKLNNVFDRNLQLEEKDRSMHEQILSSRYQNEQLKVQQEKLKQLQELQKQKKDKKQAANELWQLEQKQHEKEIQQKLFEIQQKIKYEEFKRKTDELMNQLDDNLRNLNLRYLEKQERKEKYLNDFLTQKQQTLNTSMQITESHHQNVYSNYQQQMKRIQEICQLKLKKYENKIKLINQQKLSQIDQLTQKAQQSFEHQEGIKYRSHQIFQNKLSKVQNKMNYFQDKINQIEKKRLQQLQMNYLQEQELNQKRNDVRAKSENIYRNKSLNILNKYLEKEKSFQQVQSQNQIELQQKLQRLNEKWQTHQNQVQKADQLKQSYFSSLEQKMTQRDQRLQDQIQNKLDVQKRRLKVIEDMERQKRDLLLKLEQDKVPFTNTSEMKYLYSTPKQQQSKLFIT
ncbi:unnamed protein product (macronuclear) [Paramecium tetraurelia]|uniref:DUF4515 domain-containing protein n=1 Tax=Paramecium tetraurelia TaxID=5888 RepID=A0BLN5_PARTE|nr:uncharacterized protein GSPATT00030085001 [Paramecium tetraurelia]CAK59452.1 unnamed protein product [Paramecium tetraurelia]|eukprot:XP_001426850.1 hypothetical protein (macronuclear) [Paramecium tetraurelia strain d4-2]